jgi:hypothetical protein
MMAILFFLSTTTIKFFILKQVGVGYIWKPHEQKKRDKTRAKKKGKTNVDKKSN